MSAVDLITTARNDEFAARIMMLAFNTAQQIATEPDNTPDHEQRHNYADRVLRGDENPKLLAAHVIASNPTIQATIQRNPELHGSNVPDNDLLFALASVWTARALAFSNNK